MARVAFSGFTGSACIPCLLFTQVFSEPPGIIALRIYLLEFEEQFFCSFRICLVQTLCHGNERVVCGFKLGTLSDNLKEWLTDAAQQRSQIPGGSDSDPGVYKVVSGCPVRE